MSYGLKLSTPPAVEPVSTAEMKAHLRVTSTSEDTLIDACVTAARQWCESLTGRSLISQTFELWMDRFPAESRGRDWWDGVRDGVRSGVERQLRFLELPRSPVQSVTSLSTFNDSDDETVFYNSSDMTQVIVDTVSEPARVVLREGSIWPTDLRSANAVKLVFVAGYGDAGSDVPAAIRMAVKLLAAHWYENREAMAEGTLSAQVDFGVKALLNPYTVMRL